MAKKRTMNELRQTKEYKIDPVQKVLAQQIEELAHADGIKEMVDKHETMNPSKYDGDIERDYIEEAKILIVDKITKHLSDMIFEEICNEMSNHYVFRSQNYLTEAGYEQFEDEWFEFYHEHHGDIMHEIMQNITN